jgi:hypothetical protein
MRRIPRKNFSRVESLNRRWLVAQTGGTGSLPCRGLAIRSRLGRCHDRLTASRRIGRLPTCATPRFMGSLHGFMTAHWDHEPPPRSATAFPGCGFGGLSSPPLLRATGKSPEPAGWKACSTLRFMGRGIGSRAPPGQSCMPRHWNLHFSKRKHRCW